MFNSPSGRPAGRPRLYAKKICISFTAAQVVDIEKLMDRDGLTFNDAVRIFVDTGRARRPARV